MGPNKPESPQPFVELKPIKTTQFDGDDEFTPPFSRWWPVLAGVVVGMALRLVFFGPPSAFNSAMSGAFILFAPLAVGAITVYFAERQRRRTWWYYIYAPIVATGLFVLGTLIILIEGLICAIIIVPLFALYGAVGGLLMGVICRLTKWPRPAAYCFSLLPLFIAISPDVIPEADRFTSIERSIVIHTPAADVWRQIHNTQDIQPHEVDHGWMYRIGVPLPVAGVTVVTPDETVRRITMGKNIHFEQVVQEARQNEYVRWTYRFAEDSFPPRALDDHVRIGGQYFDMLDTSYRLQPDGQTGTRLTIRMSFRVTTDFNWYANRVAEFLISDFEETILQYYKRRAERPSLPGSANASLQPALEFRL
jgi:hypothetical protein